LSRYTKTFFNFLISSKLSTKHPHSYKDHIISDTSAKIKNFHFYSSIRFGSGKL